MVVLVKISKKGKLLLIKEISDIYRYKPYKWDDNKNIGSSFSSPNGLTAV